MMAQLVRGDHLCRGTIYLVTPHTDSRTNQDHACLVHHMTITNHGMLKLVAVIRGSEKNLNREQTDLSVCIL